MKLAVSNIVWDSDKLGPFFKLCADLGCSGIELAPNKIWPEPIDAPKRELVALRNEIVSNGLELTGFHALLYTRPDLKLFESVHSFEATMAYLADLARLCTDLGGKNLIFGSPGNRNLHGHLYEPCFHRAIDGFCSLAQTCAENQVTFCIEPLPPSQTDFISSTSEGERLVKNVDHPNFRLHLDASALRVETENPEAILARVMMPEHFHANDPGLTPPGSSTDDLPAMLTALREKHYTGYISIETLARDASPIKILTQAVGYVRQALEA